MNFDPSVREAVLAAVPNLRAFAISLSGNVDRADDLVQETLLRALANIDSFQRGTNMSAWLFTILRNLFRSEYRKRRREVEDTDGSYAERLKSQPEQPGRVEFMEFRAALITAAVTGQIDVATWGKRGETDRRLDDIESNMAAAVQPERQQVRA